MAPMPPADAVMLFLFAAILISLVPGPDNVFVLAQSAMNGRLAGLFVTLGISTGLLVHTAAVSLGVAAITTSYEPVFAAIKLCGTAYLLYLAYRMFRTSDTALSPQETSLSAERLYLRGLFMNVANPKVMLFYLAFLPQFADPAHGSLALQLAVLGAMMALTAAVVFGVIAVGGGALGNWLHRKPGARIWIGRVAGVVIAAFALRLAVS